MPQPRNDGKSPPEPNGQASDNAAEGVRAIIDAAAAPAAATRPRRGRQGDTVAGRRPLAEMRHDPAVIRRLFETGEYPYRTKLRRDPYEEHMLALQRELLKCQRWIEES